MLPLLTGWFANWISRTLSTNSHTNIYLMHAPRTSQHSPGGLPGAVVESSNGVQQGDPLGTRTLLFAAALQPLASELRQAPAVAAALNHVCMRGAQLGFELNLNKCELIVVGNINSTDLTPLFPAEPMAAADGTPASSWELVLAMRISWPPGPKLGSAQPQTCWRLWVTSLILKLHSVRLLRPCGGHARLVHLMRCVPPLAQQATLLDFDVRVHHCLAAMCNGSKLPGSLATAVWHCVRHCPTPPLPTSLIGSCLDRCLDLDPMFDRRAVLSSSAATQAIPSEQSP